MKKIRLLVNNQSDRQNIINGLINSGYKISIIKEQKGIKIDYYIDIEECTNKIIFPDSVVM